jgi:hypothetical protein
MPLTGSSAVGCGGRIFGHATWPADGRELCLETRPTRARHGEQPEASRCAHSAAGYLKPVLGCLRRNRRRVFAAAVTRYLKPCRQAVTDTSTRLTTAGNICCRSPVLRAAVVLLVGGVWACADGACRSGGDGGQVKQSSVARGTRPLTMTAQILGFRWRPGRVLSCGCFMRSRGSGRGCPARTAPIALR